MTVTQEITANLDSKFHLWCLDNFFILRNCFPSFRQDVTSQNVGSMWKPVGSWDGVYGAFWLLDSLHIEWGHLVSSDLGSCCEDVERAQWTGCNSSPLMKSQACKLTLAFLRAALILLTFCCRFWPDIHTVVKKEKDWHPSGWEDDCGSCASKPSDLKMEVSISQQLTG